MRTSCCGAAFFEIQHMAGDGGERPGHGEPGKRSKDQRDAKRVVTRVSMRANMPGLRGSPTNPHWHGMVDGKTVLNDLPPDQACLSETAAAPFRSAPRESVHT